MITKEHKRELIESFKRDDADTGSPEIQIALLTARINELTEHFRTHRKDFASRRGLVGMVARRRQLLKYLRRVHPERYLDIIKRLGLRK
jgi:small subunit ribosomal protein S15